MPSTVDSYFDALEAVRDVAAAAMATTPGGAPADCAIYVDSGPPSWDELPCLIVHAGGPAVADTFPLQPFLASFHRIGVQGEVDLMSITITALRCAPTLTEEGSLPSKADREAAARETVADLWAIWNALKQKKRSGALFPPAKEREMALEPAQPVIQQGGACGWVITLRVQLDGYDPL